MNGRKKILIVDDEQINLEFFEVMLSKLGFVVAKAENGLEALDQVKRFVPDLIILDNIMPKMSGWEVTKTLKNSAEYKAFKDIPIVMFSAMDDVKDKVEGFELGVEDYITKPYNFSEVLARIRAVLRNRELFAQIAARESRIALVESLNSEFHDFTRSFHVELQRIIEAARQAGDSDFPSLVLDRAESGLKKIEHLEKKVEQTMVERERLKEAEIELKALERQYRKGMQQE